VGLRTGVDDVKRRRLFTLPELELRTLSHPARSPSLYRLLYLSSKNLVSIFIISVPYLIIKYYFLHLIGNKMVKIVVISY
jgi:hypothetical protein